VNDTATVTVISLEMTSPEQLVLGTPSPEPIELEEVGVDDADVVRETYCRIFAPLGWIGRMGWSEDQWRHELSSPDVRAWLARIGGETTGLLELEAKPSGDVGIVVFGLVPEFVGRGFGGTFLTLATELAWSIATPAGQTRRVWLETHASDHPHAMSNYEARGFRVFRTETRSA
jgi:GNAT superfamily N-acetyltransferase